GATAQDRGGALRAARDRLFLHPGRADHRPPPGRREEAARRSQSPGGRRQHGARRGASPGRRQDRRLGDRPRSRGRPGRRRDRGGGYARASRPGLGLVHGQVPPRSASSRQRQGRRGPLLTPPLGSTPATETAATAGGGSRSSARVFYGWVIVAGAFVVLFMAYGVQYSFGIFFSAMLDEFHWSRAGLAGAFSLYTFTYCAFGLLAGRLTDRWGPRAVIAVGAGFLGVGLTAMSGVSQVWHPYVLYGLVAAVGMSTAYVPCSATVARWFVRRRGLAVGLASGGMAL